MKANRAYTQQTPKMSLAGIGAMAVGVMILVVAYTIIPIVGEELDNATSIATNAYASGVLTFSGNVTTGELVNITAGGTTYTFEFNTTGSGVTAGYINVNVSGGYNTSLFAGGNLTTAINNNATLAALITAVNTTNTTTITADAAGTAANSYGTTETGANLSWATATMSGGVTGSNWDATSNTNIVAGYSLWESVGGIMKVGAIMIITTGFLTTLRSLKS